MKSLGTEVGSVCFTTFVFPGVTINCFIADLGRCCASEENINNVKLFIRGCVAWYYADVKTC
jgi:hypothetical protein